MKPFPGFDLVITGIFLICILATVVGALIAALSKRVIRGVCGLAICCFGLAGLYYFLHSPFLALMEILIYVGAVCVTIIFAVMLAEPEERASTAQHKAEYGWELAAVLVPVVLFCVITWIATSSGIQAQSTKMSDDSIKAIGVALLTKYSFAFELISLAILTAILGALAIARTGRSKA